MKPGKNAGRMRAAGRAKSPSCPHLGHRSARQVRAPAPQIFVELQPLGEPNISPCSAQAREKDGRGDERAGRHPDGRGAPEARSPDGSLEEPASRESSFFVERGAGDAKKIQTGMAGAGRANRAYWNAV